jgi:hypothetical protein
MMSNTGSYKKGRFVPPGSLEYVRRGWEDARLVLPFDAKYDTWAEWAQQNYELGRLQAVRVRAAGMVPASYSKLKKSVRADGKTCHMPRIQKQVETSILYVGSF